MLCDIRIIYIYIFFFKERGKNDFAGISKNLARYKSENNFIRPSKDVESPSMSNAAKNFDSLAISLNVPI